ncbi:prepilin-type N-terminal cleavage/methylation domain-containing protein [Erwinia mallotivora]|uniref:prepilin-type N-terminal cleavage/methylation domain-containing protein n=1 Tax=Erwinia mallotivora TaxID=69222 RepID=UPI0035E72AB1
MNKQRGFSLPETLVALLLFTLSFTALLHYQRMLGSGFQLQQQQREAWRQAWLRFEGYQSPDWQTTLKQEPVQGCTMMMASAVSHGGKQAELSQLRCELLTE